MNIKTLKSALPLVFTTKLTPLLVGAHGIGKSEIVEAVAREHGAEFFGLRLGTQDVGDLLGLADFTTDDKGQKVATKFMRPDWFPTGGKGILFLDEVNRARKDILQAVFQLVLDKRLHQHILPPAVFDAEGNWVDGWVTVAAMNPATDGYVVTDLTDKAFIDRFAYIHFKPTTKEWLDYARAKNVEEDIVSFIVAQPELLEDTKTDSAFNLDCVKPSRRSWIELNKMYRLKPSLEVFKEVAMGVVGLVATTTLMKHIEEGRLNRLTGEMILNEFPKQRDKIVKFAESGRMDILKAACDDVFNVKKDPKKDGEFKNFTKKEIENIAQFILVIPKDLGRDFADRVMNVDQLTAIIGNDDRLEAHFKG